MLRNCLGSLAERAVFFVWRLHSQVGGKWQKMPAGEHPSHGGLMTYDAALSAAGAAHCPEGELRAVGIWLGEGGGIWCLDIDGVDNANPLVLAAWQFAQETGTMFEWSSSGAGVHIFGCGELPPNLRNKWVEPSGVGIELYTAGRGMCFGLSGQAWGRADTVVLPPEWAMRERTEGDTGTIGLGAVPGHVVVSDAEVIVAIQNDHHLPAAAMLDSSLGVTGAQLWAGDVVAISARWPDAVAKGGRCSEADLALANKLARLVGGDLERVAALMWQSGLVRDKWYSNGGKVTRAARVACLSVWSRPLPPLPTPAPAITDEPHTGLAGARAMIGRTCNGETLTEVCELLAKDDWDLLQLAELRKLVRSHSASNLNIPLTAGEVRKLLPEPARDVSGSPVATGAPDWVSDWVFVGDTGRYLHVPTGMQHGRDAARTFMRGYAGVPRLPNGKQADPLEFFEDVDMWNGRRVSRTQYAPGKPEFFHAGGGEVFNTYNPDSVPMAGEPVPDDVAVVRNHLHRLCGGRVEIAQHLEWWLAWQVQRPGQLLKWAPILIGAEGVGKGFIGELARAVVGAKNFKVVGPTDIANSGGFTDWAQGGVVGVLDEVFVSGGRKYEAYNTIKQYITNENIAINRKGYSGIETVNTTNYIALSNHADALPVNDRDRRWFVVNLVDIRTADGPELHAAYMNRLFGVLARPEGLRGWLASVTLPADWPKTPQLTADKAAMILESESPANEHIRNHIVNGVFNLTDAYPKIRADMLASGDSVLSSIAIAKAAKYDLGMALVRYQKPVGIGEPHKEFKLYASKEIYTNEPKAREVYAKWEEKTLN